MPMQISSWMRSAGLRRLGGALALLALASNAAFADVLPLPKAGLRIDFHATVVVERTTKQKVVGTYRALVTCVRGPYVASFRIHQDGKRKTTSRLIAYRNVTPYSIEVSLPRGRTLNRRFFFPTDVVDAYLKSGGKEKATFAVGDKRNIAGDPVKAVREASKVTLQPLRRETVTVPAGRFETVVVNSLTVSRPPVRSIDSIVVDATGWFAPKLGYPVKIVIRQTIRGQHEQKVLQTLLAAEIGREAPPADGCRGVPAK